MNHNIDLQPSLLKVWQFQQAMQQPQNAFLNLGNKQVREMRFNILFEEVQELVKANRIKDNIETLDALIDIIYVALGSVNYHGISTFSEIFKGETFYELPQNSYVVEIVRICDSFKERYINGNFTYSEIIHFYTSVISLSVSMVYLLEAKGYFKKNCFELAFDEVHNSNMSKLENGKAIFREDGKVLKGKDYFKPNLLKLIK